MANIIETARAEHAYNKYIKGLESVAGLVDTLTGPGPFTIFVPTDAAFDSLSDDQQANMFADPGKLARVLKYHIVPGYYTADDLLDRLFLKTLERQRLRVWSDVSEIPLGEEEIVGGGDALDAPVASAEGFKFPLFLQVVEDVDKLANRHVGVVAMHQVNVGVVGTESRKAFIELPKQIARRAERGMRTLGNDDNLIANVAMS